MTRVHLPHWLFILLICLAAPMLRAQTPANDTIFIDFGNNLSPLPWNNLADPVAGNIAELLNSRELATAYSIAIFDPFNNINTAGATMPDPGIGFPATATGDSFFGNVADFGGQSQPTGGVDITGLTPDKTYAFTLFASRNGSADNREAQYVFEGATTDTIYLDAANNTSQTASVTLSPDANGRIRITAAPGPNNTNASKFYYLGALYMVYDYENIDPPTPPQDRDTLLIDFGNNPSPLPWNNVTDPVAGQIDDLLGSAGAGSGIRIAVFDPFNNINTAGTQMPNPAIGFPATATGDSFFGNVADFGGQSQPTGGVALSNLNPALPYSFNIFASRNGSNDNREAQYIFEGIATDTIYLDAANNTDSVAHIVVYPDEAGVIRLTAGPGPNNTNASKFYYLGAMKISYDIIPTALPFDTILVDFGNVLSPAPWNNLTDPAAGEIGLLPNQDGLLTSYGIRVFDPFNNINTAGSVTPDPAIGFPPTATGDSFFGNVTEFGGQVQPSGGVELYNLNTDKSYELVLFASRTASDNREAQYIIEGATTDTLYLDAASNSANVTSTSLLPAADGSIKITASPGPNNTNASGFYYLGALKVIYEEEEPFGEVSLNLTVPVGGEYWQVGKTPAIRWESSNLQGDVIIDYSTDNGNSWNNITTAPATSSSYAWTIPNTPSVECLVRLTSDTLVRISPATFEIADDTTVCRIVVLGSSTAEGAGASSQANSWVGLFRASLAWNTRYEVINLARGGYTTFHILPTGASIPSGVSISIDQARNITQALSLNPYAVIINMPSNDAANNFPVSNQLANFAQITEAARNAGVSAWVTTTQPRNFNTIAQLQLLTTVRDSIFSIYGDHAVDFWNGIAEEDAWILPQYNSGDGVHINDAGHAILFERVAALRLDTLSCTPAIINGVEDQDAYMTDAAASVFPNPAYDELFVALNAPFAGTADIRLVDMFGRLLYMQQEVTPASGSRQIRLDYSLRQSSVKYMFCVVTMSASSGQTARVVLPVVVR